MSEALPETVHTTAGPWRWAIVESDLDATVKHVALTLAVRMDADGTIPKRYRPGQRRLAEDASRKRETVAEAVAQLEALGYLQVTVPGVGRRAEYRAVLPAGHARSGPSTGASPELQSGPSTGAGSGESGPSTGAGHRPESGPPTGASPEEEWPPSSDEVAPQTPESGPPRGTTTSSTSTTSEVPRVRARGDSWRDTWRSIEAEIARVGTRPGYADQRHRFGPRAEAAIRQLGGWRALCEIPDRQARGAFADAWHSVDLDALAPF